MKTRPALLLAAPALALPLAVASPAIASDNFQVPLDELNNSGASGTAVLRLQGRTLQVTIDAHGLVPSSPHAQHIHGSTTGHNFTCPTKDEQAALDNDGNGVVSTSEAAPKYGPVFIALTTKGDISAKSGLAISRMPVSDAQGNLHYDRTIHVSQATADNIANLHVVEHGIDSNGDGRYDGKQKSDLDPKLPAEATDPADCGALEASQTNPPSGGVATGTGGTQGVEHLPLFVLSGMALVGSAGALGLRRRSLSLTR